MTPIMWLISTQLDSFGGPQASCGTNYPSMPGSSPAMGVKGPRWSYDEDVSTATDGGAVMVISDSRMPGFDA